MKTTTLVIGALLLVGGLYLYKEHEAAAKVAPSLESKANLALASESNPYTLEALSQQCDANGLHTLAGLLHAKSQAILAAQGPAKTEGVQGGDFHPAATISMMAAGITNPAVASQAVALHQSVVGLTGLTGGGLDPNTGSDTGPGVHAPRYLQ